MDRCEFCPVPGGPEACNPDEAEVATLTLDEAGTVIGCMRARLGENKQTITGLEESNQDLERRIDVAEQLVERLSVDAELGILTFNSQRVLFERMIASGLLSELHQQGYTIEMMILDLDKLKLHNELGAHAGGNAALACAVGRVRPLYRRKTDVVAGILHHEAEAAKASEHRSHFAQVGRFEKGDEIITISFLPPPRSGDRRDPLTGLEGRRRSIVAALNGASVIYPLRTRKSRESIEAEFGAFEYTIDADSRVHAPVSATFAVARSQVPDTMLGFENLFGAIDNALTTAKQGRREIATKGVVLDLLAS